jgi:NADH dehydrogenase FAD-containing subunit
LNERGYVQVTPTLQVRDHASIFAAGDITDLPEAKQYAKTAGHARTVVANIVSFLKKEALTKETKAATEIIMISNGRVSDMFILFSTHD